MHRVIRLIPNLKSRTNGLEELCNLGGAIGKAIDIIVPIPIGCIGGRFVGVSVVSQDDQRPHTGVAISPGLLTVKGGFVWVNLIPAAGVVKGEADHLHAELL